MYYHLKETSLVPGFNKGKCKIPVEYNWKIQKKAKDCGGYSKELIKNNFWVKKGQVIGLSGTTGKKKGDKHISLGIAVPPDEGFRNYLIETTKDLNLLEGTHYIDWSKCDDATFKFKFDWGCYKDGKILPKKDRKKIKSYSEMCPSSSCTFSSGKHWVVDLLRAPDDFTEKHMKYTAPQKVFKWENLPTDSDAYLFPVMSKKYLKEIGYYK